LACAFATDGCKKWKEGNESRPAIFKGGLNNDMKNSNDLYARGLRLSWSDFDTLIANSRDPKPHVCGIT